MEHAFTVQHIIGKRREYNFETHLAFVDYEKAFDYISKNRMWRVLDNFGNPTHLINIIKGDYHDTKV